MRRPLRWLIGAPSVLAVAAAGIVVYFAFIDTGYSHTELHADTGVAAVLTDGRPSGFVTCPERPGCVTLVFARGDTGGPLATRPPWSERLVVQLPRPTAGDRVDLAGPGVRAAFGAFDGRQFAAVGPGGIRGEIRIEATGPDELVATCDVVVDAVYSQRLAADRNQEVAFRGRFTFRVRPRPDGAAPGHLWPAPDPPKSK
jgi:hypothetical protein